MKIETEFNIDEKVFDDLTGTEAIIIGITFSAGYTEGNLLRNSCNCIGYWLNNQYLEGSRHPWEITKLNA